MTRIDRIIARVKQEAAFSEKSGYVFAVLKRVLREEFKKK